MDNIDKLLKKIIPPDTREEREGFSNEGIFSKLNQEELKLIEERLIEMLKTNSDVLIAQTLVQLDSQDSIPTMVKRLKSESKSFSRIKWASIIDEIKKGDEEMEKIAFEEFEKLEFIYEVQGVVFYDLIKFNSPRINKRINEFINHKYFLVAHHAKEVLNLNDNSELNKNGIATKHWWQFWK